MSIPYTKALVKLTPLSVAASPSYAGRSLVTLRAEYSNGETSEIYMLLPKDGKQGDSLTVSHTLYLDTGNDPATTDVFDHVLRAVGFRSEAERVN